MLDALIPWLPVIAATAAAVAIIAAVGRAMLAVSRSVTVRREGKVVAIVTPIIDIRLQEVDTALRNLRLEQGATKKVVDEVKAIVSNGLTEDVTYLRSRLDDIYDHLIGD